MHRRRKLFNNEQVRWRRRRLWRPRNRVQDVLGFVVFLAFAGSRRLRAGAETEAIIVAQQVETAQLMPADVRQDLTVGLVCYARSVTGVQWERMEWGRSGTSSTPGASSSSTRSSPPTRSPRRSNPPTTSGSTRRPIENRQARSDRIHEQAGPHDYPTPLWLVLFFTSAVIFVYTLFFADSGERIVVQGLLMGTVASVIAAMLLLLVFLDNPFHPGLGGLRPVAMEPALDILDQELEASGLNLPALRVVRRRGQPMPTS